MNYKELEEKASKGPFFVEPDNGWYNIRAIAKGKLGYAEYAVTNEGIPDEANAQLIAHTLNTYEALLEALEEMLGLATLGANGCVVMKARQALKDAQNVEGA